MAAASGIAQARHARAGNGYLFAKAGFKIGIMVKYMLYEQIIGLRCIYSIIGKEALPHA
jgi:hypothetical protein